jgi:hypothetical protein
VRRHDLLGGLIDEYEIARSSVTTEFVHLLAATAVPGCNRSWSSASSPEVRYATP